MSKEIKNMTFWERYLNMKLELEVKKDEWNTHGKFNFRSKESILKAVKPLENKYNILVETDNEIVVIEGRLFAEGEAQLRDVNDGQIKITKTSKAELQPMGSTRMNESQLTGSAESYACKRALEALFGLDDGVDGDNEALTSGVKTLNEVKVKKPQGLKEIQEDKPQIKSVGAKPVSQVQTVKVVGKVEPKPVEPIEVEEEVKEVEDVKRHTNYELQQRSLLANTVEEINELLEQALVTEDNKMTINVINSKALSLGLKKNINTNKWEER